MEHSLQICYTVNGVWLKIGTGEKGPKMVGATRLERLEKLSKFAIFDRKRLDFIAHFS